MSKSPRAAAAAATFVATSAKDESAVLSPDREASSGLTSPERFEGRPVGDRDHPVRRQSSRQFLLGDALLLDALKQRWGHQHDSDA